MLVTTPETSFYVDIEAQRSATPGYQIVKRACFYVARILSWQQSQNFRISKDGKYDDLKKVYGIWVCMNNTEDRVVSLGPIPKALYGELEITDYPDLSDIFMLYLPRICSVERGKTKGGVERLNRILNVLLTNQLSETDKIEILRSEGVIVEEIKEDIHRMCNLSEMVFEDGVAHGMERGILIGTKDGMERGILIGTENGKTAERISIVKTQLSMKFKDVSFDWVSTLTQDKLDDIIKRIFDITFEEVMAMKSS